MTKTSTAKIRQQSPRHCLVGTRDTEITMNPMPNTLTVSISKFTDRFMMSMMIAGIGRRQRNQHFVVHQREDIDPHEMTLIGMIVEVWASLPAHLKSAIEAICSSNRSEPDPDVPRRRSF